MREMKDSGIAWIGAMPRAWKMNTIAQIFLQVKCKNTGLQEKNLLSLSYGKVKRKSIDTVEGLLPESFDGYNIIEKDDIVLRLTDLQNDHTSLRVGLAEERGIITSAYLTIRNRSNFCPKYLYYYLHSFDIAKGFYGMGAGVRQGLNWDGVKWLKILAPLVPEQERIAAFLDAECAEIDAVLEKTRASIEEYKKLKQAVITQAVTKGIRGDRPMKDSGIEWIGEIPAEWDYTKAKNCVNIQNGSDPKTEGSIPVYGSGASSFKTCGEYKEGPSVLIGRKGATLHIPHYISTKFWNVDTAFNVYAKPNFDLKFYFYCACSFDYRFYISQTTLPSMTQTAYENMFLPLPSNDEQRAIASYLDNRCEEIDALIWKKQECLVEIENYKKSLIYEYVTGKKEVKTSVLAD